MDPTYQLAHTIIDQLGAHGVILYAFGALAVGASWLSGYTAGRLRHAPPGYSTYQLRKLRDRQ